MITPKRPRAYVVAVQFGDPKAGGFLACCPFIAFEPAMAVAQVAAEVASKSGCDLPLVAANCVEMPAAWLRQALAEIEPGGETRTGTAWIHPEGSA